MIKTWSRGKPRRKWTGPVWLYFHHKKTHSRFTYPNLLSIFIPDRRQSKTLLTIVEHGSKLVRNSVFHFHLSPVGRQMAIEISVSNYFLSTFVYNIDVYDCRLWLRLSPFTIVAIRCDIDSILFQSFFTGGKYISEMVKQISAEREQSSSIFVNSVTEGFTGSGTTPYWQASSTSISSEPSWVYQSYIVLWSWVWHILDSHLSRCYGEAAYQSQEHPHLAKLLFSSSTESKWK